MFQGRTVAYVLIGTVVIAITGCSARPIPAGPIHDRDRVVTAEEIMQSGAKTAWDAIRLTVKHINLQNATAGAPQRVVRRGRSSIVLRDEVRILVDDLRIGDVAVLHQIAAAEIALIRVLSGIDATTRYGTNSGDGVILISTRAGAQ